MPLLALWKSNPQVFADFNIEQIVATAGNGDLRDNSECSREFRSYLSEISSSRIAGYTEQCLTKSFPAGGKVLQDLINELGRRLEYQVVNGRYQGVQNGIGFDGLWHSVGHSLVVEVKTIDAYRISLDTLAGYRSALIQRGDIPTETQSSVLLVVGRQDTGELEAQIRGSRHAWDMRVISIEALLKLVDLKERTDTPATVDKIRNILRPFEYTRVDQLVDIVFTAARDVEVSSVADLADHDDRGKVSESVDIGVAGYSFTPPDELNAKRQAIIDAFSNGVGVNLVKRSRALFWSADHSIRIVCTVSKRYDGAELYWFAYHPQWDEFLGDAADGYVVLGCMDIQTAFAIPVAVLRQNLGNLNVTERADGHRYWHLKIVETGGVLALYLPRIGSYLPLTGYELALQ